MADMTHSPRHPQTASGGFGHAWPALLLVTQANRDAAAALLLAMQQAFGNPSGHAMQPDELHCWYTDAHDADVASQAADTLMLLTTNASTVLATTGAATSIAAAPSLIHATPLSAHTVAVEPSFSAQALLCSGSVPWVCTLSLQWAAKKSERLAETSVKSATWEGILGRCDARAAGVVQCGNPIVGS